MKIKKIEINNWRSIVHEVIEFNNLMIFIGQNNHGKSNILSAIRFFFGEISAHELDYNNKAKELWIEIEFDDLNESEISTFHKYVTSLNTIRVRKSASVDGKDSYNGYTEIPDEEWLKEENISQYQARDLADILPLADFLPQKGRISKEAFKKAQELYIEGNHENLSFNYMLEGTPFLGAKNVAKGIFGELFYIPSIKKATDEFNARGNSVFSKLYSKVISKISENDPAYIDAKAKIIELTKILNKTDETGKKNPKRPKELTILEKSIDQELKSWNTTIDIEITPPNIDDIYKIGANIWIDDGIKTDIERKGHGLQRALIFALVKAWSDVIKDENTSIEENTNRKASESSYFVFEEPELFLHPQAQRELFSSLLELLQNNNQIILCTHSSSFLDLNYYKSICIVKKNSIHEGTKVLQYTKDIFEDLEAKKRFNLCYWFNPERSELFFAKKVILIEGSTDKSVISFLAKKINIFRYDYSIIDCGSKDNIPLYINLLNKFKLKYIAAYDKDHQVYKQSNGIDSANISSKCIEDSLNSKYGESIVFINDIEEEIGMISTKENKNKPFKAMEHIEKDEYIIPISIKEKIERIYK